MRFWSIQVSGPSIVQMRCRRRECAGAAICDGVFDDRVEPGAARSWWGGHLLGLEGEVERIKDAVLEKVFNGEVFRPQGLCRDPANAIALIHQ